MTSCPSILLSRRGRWGRSRNDQFRPLGLLRLRLPFTYPAPCLLFSRRRSHDQKWMNLSSRLVWQSVCTAVQVSGSRAWCLHPHTFPVVPLTYKYSDFQVFFLVGRATAGTRLWGRRPSAEVSPMLRCSPLRSSASAWTQTPTKVQAGLRRVVVSVS